MHRGLVVAASVAVLLAVPVHAVDRNERVRFARGATSKALAGSIRGNDWVNYIVGARAGQTLSVNFRSPNGAAYFNVWAPGSDEAIFVGSNEGNSFAGTLSVSGDYRVQVYLYRNAARRGERAPYRLTIGVR